jgi:hypothetical protein
LFRSFLFNDERRDEQPGVTDPPHLSITKLVALNLIRREVNSPFAVYICKSVVPENLLLLDDHLGGVEKLKIGRHKLDD